jgi:hypothetical protein
MRSLASRVARLGLAVVAISAPACRQEPIRPAETVEKSGSFGSHQFSVRRDGESAVVVFTPPLLPADESFVAGAAAATYATFGATLRENAVHGTAAEYTVNASNGWNFKLSPVKAASGEIAGARIERLP